MSGILDLINSDMGQQLISGTGNQMGLDKNTTSSALSTAIPLILGAMKNNSSSAEGSEQILNALGNSKHSGSMLDNIGGILGGGSIDQDVMDDGGKILGHVFGGQENNAASALSKSSGIDIGSAMNMLKVAAPFIMSYLGKQKSQNNISDQGGLGDLLGGLLGGQGSTMESMASLIQGFDSNDSSIDDIAGLVSGASGSQGGLGDLLKGFMK